MGGGRRSPSSAQRKAPVPLWQSLLNIIRYPPIDGLTRALYRYISVLENVSFVLAIPHTRRVSIFYRGSLRCSRHLCFRPISKALYSNIRFYLFPWLLRLFMRLFLCLFLRIYLRLFCAFFCAFFCAYFCAFFCAFAINFSKHFPAHKNGQSAPLLQSVNLVLRYFSREDFCENQKLSFLDLGDYDSARKDNKTEWNEYRS